MSKAMTIKELEAFLLENFNGTVYDGPAFEIVETGDQVAVYANEGVFWVDKFIEFEGVPEAKRIETQRFTDFGRFKAMSRTQHFAILKGELLRQPGPAHDVTIEPAAAKSEPAKKKARAKK